MQGLQLPFHSTVYNTFDIACMCAGMFLCDGKYPNQVQQGASEASPPACNIKLIDFVYLGNIILAVENNADPNQKDKDGLASIHWACHGEYVRDLNIVSHSNFIYMSVCAAVKCNRKLLWS